MENLNCKNWYEEFNTLPNGQEALVRYSPLHENLDIYKGETVSLRKNSLWHTIDG